MQPKFDRVILIDDDPITNLINRSLIGYMSPGQEIAAFTDAEEALLHLPAGKKILVFLDINMPGFDGWDFLDAWQMHPLKGCVSIYMLSSSPACTDRERALRYPDVKGYIVKPATAEIITSIWQQPSCGSKLIDADQMQV